MRARRDAALRLLKTMLVASVFIPAAFFIYASWLNYHIAFTRADEQLSVSLNILSEQASKVFQSVDLTFAGVDAVLGDLTDEQIKGMQAEVDARWKRLENRVNHGT